MTVDRLPLPDDNCVVSGDMYDRLFQEARHSERRLAALQMTPEAPSRSRPGSAKARIARRRQGDRYRRRAKSMPNTDVTEDMMKQQLRSSLSDQLTPTIPKENANCLLVRRFTMTSRGLVKRGDERRSRHGSGQSSRDSLMLYDVKDFLEIPQVQVETADGDSSVSYNLGTEVSSSPEVPHCHVSLVGMSSVGKTSLVNLFLAANSHDVVADVTGVGETTPSVSVDIDGRETLLDLSEAETLPLEAEQDALLVVFSTADRASYLHALAVLQQLRQTRREDTPTILVGNKSDLVRTRQVTASEAVAVAANYQCKYVETSVTVDHHVDELLAGIVTQLRLYRESKKGRISPPRNSSKSCGQLALNLVSCVLRSPKKKGKCSAVHRNCRDLYSS